MTAAAYTCRVTPATRQEAFDAAARHLLTTGKPSFEFTEGYPSCQYGGSGCALAPFAPTDPQELAAWDHEGAITDLPADWLPDFISEDIDFFNALQCCHDQPPAILRDTQLWREAWLASMRQVAHHFRLSPAVLDEGFADAPA